MHLAPADHAWLSTQADLPEARLRMQLLPFLRRALGDSLQTRLTDRAAPSFRHDFVQGIAHNATFECCETWLRYE